jgi:hypothetical protein
LPGSASSLIRSAPFGKGCSAFAVSTASTPTAPLCQPSTGDTGRFRARTGRPVENNAASPESGLSAIVSTLLRAIRNSPSYRHAFSAHSPCTPHKFRQPDNLSALVGMIGLISSGTPLAETLAFVGLVGIWPSGLTAPPRQRLSKKYIGDRLTAPRRFYRGVTSAAPKISR